MEDLPIDCIGVIFEFIDRKYHDMISRTCKLMRLTYILGGYDSYISTEEFDDYDDIVELVNSDIKLFERKSHLVIYPLLANDIKIEDLLSDLLMLREYNNIVEDRKVKSVHICGTIDFDMYIAYTTGVLNVIHKYNGIIMNTTIHTDDEVSKELQNIDKHIKLIMTMDEKKKIDKLITGFKNIEIHDDTLDYCNKYGMTIMEDVLYYDTIYI
jgi:hypothetical protein